MTICDCGDSMCDLRTMSHEELIEHAHKIHSLLRTATQSAIRRAIFIRNIGTEDEFVRWSEEVYEPKIPVNLR